ncbi:MAG: hypothetical protein ABMA00_13630 [Gemmatimonas sp.]
MPVDPVLSVRRKQEAQFRRNPKHDAHVREFWEISHRAMRANGRRIGAKLHDHHVVAFRYLERKRERRKARAEAAGRAYGKHRHRIPAEEAAIPRHQRESFKQACQKPAFKVRKNALEKVRRNRKRVAAGLPTRRHDAHVKAWAAWADEQRRRQEKHDWHVVEAKRCNAWRGRYKTATDPGYRLNARLRVQIRKALRGQKNGRRWEQIVGYTQTDLAKHLQRMLPQGKTLHECLSAGWHIDHIVPKSAYDLRDEGELRKAWCLSNLRLIPAVENLRKRATRISLL